MIHRIQSALFSVFVALVCSSPAVADVVTVPFNEGFVGLRGSNNQDADTVVTFGDLGFDATFFTQVSPSGTFIGSGAQGNDVAGTLRLRRGNTIYNIEGRIGWQLKEQGSLMLFGFLPNSNISTIALTTPTGYTLPAGIMMKDVADLDPNSTVYTTVGGETVYYITGDSNFGVTKHGTALSDVKPLTSAPRGIDTGEDVGGSADGSGILDALNSYLSTASSQRPLGPITVNSQTTADTTPVVTGSVTLQSGEYLVILINGEVYMTSNGLTGPSDDGNAGTWSIEIPAGKDLTAGSTYDVSAMIYNAAGWLLEDSTTNELVITNGVTALPSLKVQKTVNDAALSDGADVGDTLIYQIAVTNTGNVPLYDLSWTDSLSNGTGSAQSLTLGTPSKTGSGASTTDGALLEVGDTLAFSLSYALTQADIDSGEISNIATIEALSTDGDSNTAFSVESSSTGNATSGTGNGAATLRSLTRTPAITVTKSVAHTDSDNDGAVSLGDTLAYTVSAENTGNVTLQGLTLTDDFQRADSTALSATLSAIAYSAGSSDSAFLPGGTASATFAHIIDQDDVDAGGLSNAATGAAWIDLNGDSQRASDSSEDATDTTDSRLDTAIGSTGAIALTKTATLNDGDDGVGAGDTITYSFTVQNTGAVSLSNIKITDPMVIVQGTLATLAVGATDSTTFSATYTITQADIDTGEVNNTATVTADSPSGTDDVTDTSSETGSGDSATVTTLTRSPAITVTKSVAHTDSDNDGAVSLGDTLTYTVTAENTGNVTLQGLSLTDDFQRADSTLLSATLSAIAYSTDSSDSAFLPGGTASATFAHIIDQDDVDAGGLSNAATGTAWIDLNGDSQRASDSSEDATDTTDSRLDTAIGSTGAIALTKTATLNDGGDGVNVGDTITYNFTVQNTGAVSLSNIEITDPMVTVQGTLATLAVGATDSTTFTATYTITQADIDAGTVSNTATVTADSPSGTDDVTDTSSETGTGDSATVTSLTRTPAITVTKSIAHTDSDNDGAVSLGDTLTYTVTAENTGNVTLHDIAVDEDFARQDGTTLSPALPALTFTSGSDADAMLPGAVGVLSFAHVITQADVDAGGVTNSATATAWHDADQNGKRRKNGSEDISDTVDQAIETPITGTPKIAVRKSGVLNDNDGTLGTSLGDTITYLLEVKNTGNVTLTDVQVSDPLFGGVVPQTIAALAPGETDSVTFELVYDVSISDLDRGYVSNLATASGTAASQTVSDISGPTFDTDKEIVTFLGSISGHVTDGQQAKAGVTVILYDQATGLEVARQTTGSDGAYAFIQIEQGTYAISFVPPEGAAVHSHSAKGEAQGAQVQGIEVAAGADRIVSDVDAIVVDPSGVIYNAITRAPISGATVTLLHNGSAVPDAWLDITAGDANNVVTGADGMYSFLLQSPAQTGTYSLQVSHPDYTFVSQIVPPQAGSLTTSLGFGVEQIVASANAPDAANGDETYYLAFDFTFGDWTDQATLSKGVIHNHIAMDPANFSTGLRVTKVADDSALSERPQVGEVIAYTITVENIGDLDYDTVVLDDPLTANEALTTVAGTTDDGVLNAGETWTYTASYALTTADLRRAKVQNLATLSADLIAGSNAVTGATPTGNDLGGTYVYESAPAGNTSEGAGNGTATVTKLSAGLIDQIKDDLITLIEDDIRVTMQRQTEMVSGWRASALERMKVAIADRSALRSYETKDPLTGSVEASAGVFALDTQYEKERFDAQSRTWTINSADLVFSEDEALGTQLMLTFNHRREKLHDSDRLSGRYIGGYMTRTTVDTLAEGEINGYGLNAGIYGASRPYQRLFFDYHLGAVAGKHSYDLDFARDQTINATGDFTYLGVTGGVALSGEIKSGDTIIAPRIGIDGFYTPETDTDVTATSGPFTEKATLDVGSVSSGRLFVETRFSNDLSQAHDGKGIWDGLDAELALTLRAFCDAFDDLDTRCGLGAGFDYVRENEDQTRLQKLTLSFDKSGDHVAARLGLGLERHFAKGAGTTSLNLSADQMGNPSVEYSVNFEF